MPRALRRAYERFFGVGDAAPTIPVMDGALKPNNILEEAEVVFEAPGLEDLLLDRDERVVVACRNLVLRIEGTGVKRVIAEADKPVQAFVYTDDGLLAIATADGISFHGGAGENIRREAGKELPLKCVNALAADGAGKLFISQGSATYPNTEWTRDLLGRGTTGRVVRYDLATRASELLASGLAYCSGVIPDGRSVFASESWSHRIIAVSDDHHLASVDDLPGYPGRISRASDGGFWLAVFAVRSQLLELVLRDDDFRRDMMEQVEPRYWIAPALSSGEDFLEPMQIGGVRMMGILKPWAPARSYGLVVRFDSQWRPLYSLHSRAGGRHHGVVAAAESNGDLYVLSKGAGRVLRVPLRGISDRLSR